jgi:hypothetical protein
MYSYPSNDGDVERLPPYSSATSPSIHYEEILKEIEWKLAHLDEITPNVIYVVKE